MRPGALALAGAVACACGTPRSPDPEVPPGIVDVLEESTVIKSGAIGVKEQKDATYVLVDARNTSSEERLVALRGALLDESGKEIGPLSDDELRIPPGETRTFALVYGGVAANAKSARLLARRAEPSAALPVVVAEQTTEKEGAALAAVCRVENQHDRTAVVTVVATFYDEGGTILARPFSLLEIQPRSSRPFRFNGPPGSATAKVFLGQVTF